MFTWLTDASWSEYKAAGKHLASYVAGGVTVAVAFGLLSSQNATDINADINLITDGAKKVFEGLAGIIGVLTPIYTAWRAAHNASPAQQKIAVRSIPNTMVITTTPQSSDTAVAKKLEAMPEVVEVVASPAVAASTGPKVVSTPTAGATP